MTSDTILHRRQILEELLQEILSTVVTFEHDRIPSVGRPRTAGHVFLTAFDGFTPSSRLVDEVLPVAVALELASLQSTVHRQALESGPSSVTDLTHTILRGDLLESSTFEVLAGYDAPPVRLEQCLERFTRATRRVQEGYAIVSGVDADGQHSRSEVVQRLGALTGCGIELAGTLAAVDSVSSELIRRANTFGFHVWYRTTGQSQQVDTTEISTRPSAPSKQLDSLVECWPSRSRDLVDEQLTAFLELSLDYESPDSIADLPESR
ncbi:polyprenyl synthetase family protein [Natronobacterium gregoryi]|uniref:Farnesyltranstransferase n=2 Tax=Natronobacterium gregoryi TaxID=44930 RepID=L0AEZ7_NATGS|nr:hypothetical protein [Natronobacterium gregoryi]AFZ72493.1 hypothetical protein Natgr_1270 [Natronobacterium gregoryi SP2]ELY74365.1 farnesyltranstransferase [Natronobacterium gregoryi SP2]PLK21463.1 farnesyltranstransferase [Natronobacterium gregoryi SP2]SFI77221.1 hypothetical protein SAMN05443661_10573 [Natronobacterium gregoryi]